MLYVIEYALVYVENYLSVHRCNLVLYSIYFLFYLVTI